MLRSEKILYGCQARPAGIGLRVLFLMMHNLPTRADLGRLSPTRVLSQRGIRGAHQGSKCEFAQVEGRVAKTRSSQWIQWKFDPIGSFIHSFFLRFAGGLTSPVVALVAFFAFGILINLSFPRSALGSGGSASSSSATPPVSWKSSSS